MKTAKSILTGLLAVMFCIGLTGTGIAAGGNGNGQGGGNGQSNGGGLGQGNGTGICISSQLVSKEPFTQIYGTVADVGFYGQGVSVDTGVAESVQVYGIGPIRYWEDVLGIARPDVGEDITVSGREVTFSDGTEKFIAFIVEIADGEEIILRDEGTGLPLWRAEGRQWRHQHQYTECNCTGSDDTAL